MVIMSGCCIRLVFHYLVSFLARVNHTLSTWGTAVCNCDLLGQYHMCVDDMVNLMTAGGGGEPGWDESNQFTLKPSQSGYMSYFFIHQVLICSAGSAAGIQMLKVLPLLLMCSPESAPCWRLVHFLKQYSCRH